MNEWESDYCPVCRKPVVIQANPQLSEQNEKKYESLVYVPGQKIEEIILTAEQRKLRKEIKQFLDESRPAEVALERY